MEQVWTIIVNPRDIEMAPVSSAVWGVYSSYEKAFNAMLTRTNNLEQPLRRISSVYLNGDCVIAYTDDWVYIIEKKSIDED